MVENTRDQHPCAWDSTTYKVSLTALNNRASKRTANACMHACTAAARDVERGGKRRCRRRAGVAPPSPSPLFPMHTSHRVLVLSQIVASQENTIGYAMRSVSRQNEARKKRRGVLICGRGDQSTIEAEQRGTYTHTNTVSSYVFKPSTTQKTLYRLMTDTRHFSCWPAAVAVIHGDTRTTRIGGVALGRAAESGFRDPRYAIRTRMRSALWSLLLLPPPLPRRSSSRRAYLGSFGAAAAAAAAV